MSSKVLVIDTETHSKNDPIPIEIAYYRISYPSLTKLESFNQRFNPGVPMDYGAIAVHNILPQELDDKPNIKEFVFPSDIEYIIGHNIDFDWKALSCPDVKRIDTLAICRTIYENSDSHTQSAMLYYVYGCTPYIRDKLKNAHSALADIDNLLDLIKAIAWPGLMPQTIEELWEFSEKCRIPKYITFGKYGNPKTEITKLPYDYKYWLLNKTTDLDPYLKIALENSMRK